MASNVYHGFAKHIQPHRKRKIEPRRFQDLWLSNATNKQIEEEFGVSSWTVHNWRVKLNLPPREQGYANPNSAKYFTERKARTLQKFRVLRIIFSIGNTGHGAFRTIREYIKEEYVGKRFKIPLENRTEIVRLFMDAIKKKPYTFREIHRIRSLLSRYHLTRAEQHAILFSLGYRYRSKKGQFLDNLKINGYLDRKSQLLEASTP